NPPPSHRLWQPYETLNALEADLKDWAKVHGFAISRTRSSKYREIVQGEGKVPTQVDWYCDRGRPRGPRGHSRTTSTSKVDCSWKAHAAASFKTD
ncbi:hypothetical protein QBC33DRAFT_463079, partial [Phialemonium atrogriseum]